MNHFAVRGILATLVLVLYLSVSQSAQAELQILLPLARQAYQTNETIDVSVVRSGAAALPAGDLVLTVVGESGSRASFTFPLPAVAVSGTGARDTVHLHLNGWLLRPDKYTLEVAADGATAKSDIDVHSHVRQSSFKLIQWGSRAAKAEQGVLGEQSLGLNLIYASYGGLEPDELIRTGADYMWCCTMSGAHQMDIRQECDWSDPYVLRGGTARVVRRALQDRTRPNAIGVHFYDEPGLTWWKHPATGVMVPFNIPWQDRAYKTIFGQDPPQYNDVDPAKPDVVRRWKEMNRWKEQFMEAAWKYSSYGVSRVQPGMLSVTQSVYGATAYADGYYFNVVRSLPIISGHGGYDDYGLLYHNPAYTFQLGRMRQYDKPNWYLPTWYSNEPSDRFRMEQYLSFMDNLQGMAVPPDITVQKPESVPATEGVVESNLLMARLGTVFTTQPVDRGDIAVLDSLSQALDAEVKDLKVDINRASYEAGGHNRNALGLVYLASRMIQTQIYPIVEEDVVDGTLAAQYRGILIPTVQALDPPVIKALEAFVVSGGLVLVSDDSKVQIKGATKLGVPTQAAIFGKIGELWPLAQTDKAKAAELKKLNNVGSYYQAAAPIALALQARLKERGIRPAFACDNREVAGTRQAFGDLEYLFAVNAAYGTAEGEGNSIQSTSAVIGLPTDGRPIYDAILGGAAAQFKSQGDQLAAQFRFGPGQMRVFARTARPIGGVQVLTPLVTRDLTASENPFRVQIGATLVDDAKQVLVGSAPLRIRLVDPSGAVRYDLYRATDQGTLKLTLPLAANDPPGKWKVVVQELLNNSESSAPFTYTAPAQCGAIAGRTPRAVSFGNDRENIFRFFQNFKDVTIVTGASPYNAAAADRLVKNLLPWGVRAKIVPATEAAKPRPISDDEAPTWVGLDPGRAKAGSDNPINVAGFNVSGPVLLLGTPADNPLIDFALKQHFLPYVPDAENFPGRTHGYLAWQRDAVGYAQESITLIAYDEAGMSEAVGSLQEDVSAFTPLTRWDTSVSNTVAPATKTSTGVPEAKAVWQLALSDRAAAIKADAGGQLTIIELDDAQTRISADGKPLGQEILAHDAALQATKAMQAPADPAAAEVAAKQQIPGLLLKRAVTGAGRTAISYWGGTLRVVDAAGTVKSQQRFSQDIAALTFAGDKLVVALADGKLIELKPE
jgi:hypothetical protein